MSEIYKNYFSPKSVAQRYAKGRPRFHSFVVHQIKEFLKISEPLPFVMDVGCGTGLSTIALKEIAHKIIALDISSEMLALAPKSNNLHYLLASAENIPISEPVFDLIIISQAVHWLDKDKFFAEAKKVLKHSGWIVVFDNYYTGQIVDNTKFNAWHLQKYLQTFPSVPKNPRSFQQETINGFSLIQENWHENKIELSSKELVNYLITQSNVIAAVENGTQTIEDVTKWLTDEISQFFDGNAKKTFIFKAPIWYLQSNSAND
jgi:ubiquinone/menaquinone biosynthesis C-methylase UbiE